MALRRLRVRRCNCPGLDGNLHLPSESLRPEPNPDTHGNRDSNSDRHGNAHTDSNADTETDADA
jgi:hypothetical protein